MKYYNYGFVKHGPETVQQFHMAPKLVKLNMIIGFVGDYDFTVAKETPSNWRGFIDSDAERDEDDPDDKALSVLVHCKKAYWDVRN